jgi:hypothetical protein
MSKSSFLAWDCVTTSPGAFSSTALLKETDNHTTKNRGHGRRPSVARIVLGSVFGLAFVSAYFGIYANDAILKLKAGPSFSGSQNVKQPSSLKNQSIAGVEGKSDLDDEVQLKQRFYASVVAEHRKAAVERAARGPFKVTETRRKPHPGLSPMAPQFQPDPAWRQSKFPDINIVGLAKGGTSQLYKILVSHPETIPFRKGLKEECLIGLEILEDWNGFVPGRQPTSKQLILQKSLFNAFQRVSNNSGTSPFKQSVNGCLMEHKWSVVHQYIQPPQEKKYIIALRDPAEWLWAGYNFWTNSKVDAFTSAINWGWTNPARNYRSPEMFHELVASSYATNLYNQSMKLLEDSFLASPWKYDGMVGRENILFIRNEDMLPGVVEQKGGVLDRISEFTGLDRDGFDPNIFGSIVNCNDVKGGVSGGCGATKSSAYEITGGRSMLPETRTLIYLRFHEECKLWSERYNAVYTDCLNVLESTKQKT